jgi:type I restriction enzyme S subunit
MTDGEWKTVALDKVATIERDAIQPEAIGQGTAYLGLEHIESGGKILGAKLVDQGELASSKFKFTDRHVLYGKLRPYLAKIACPDFTGICSTDILPILPGPNLERRFLCYFLRQPSMVDYANSRAAGANLPRLSPSALAEFEIPLPPLAEQRRIAEVLDRAEALRAKRRAALAQLDALTQSLFLDLFGDPIKNPHGCPVRPMIELIDPQRPISYGILMPGPDQADGVKYVRVVDMKNGGIELSGIRKTTEAISNSFRRSLLKTGDLLMSIRGHVGRFAVVPPELDGANITQDTARLAIVGASSVFVRECLRTEGFQRWMAKHTKGVAVRGINLGDVKLMPIMLPPRTAQDKFARQANVVEALKTAHRASLAELDALFASLQHRAFKGEL